MSLAVHSPHSEGASLPNEVGYLTAATSGRGRGGRRGRGSARAQSNLSRPERMQRTPRRSSSSLPGTSAQALITEDRIIREDNMDMDVALGSVADVGIAEISEDDGISPEMGEDGEPELDVLDEIIVVADNREESEDEEVILGREQDDLDEPRTGGDASQIAQHEDEGAGVQEEDGESEKDDEQLLGRINSPEIGMEETEPAEEVRMTGIATKLKLVIGKRGGRKRKAEDEESKEDQAEEMSLQSSMRSPDGAEDVQMETGDLDRGDEPDMGDMSKRMPRKKRKWLKKGEIDLDDPIAVARQKERHQMITQAVASLDKQAAIVKSGSHPQLLDMLKELERRKTKQHERNEAKYNAAIADLEAMRSHEIEQATFNWKVRRESLVKDLTTDNWHRMSSLHQEKNLLRRIPSAFPNLRDGRGGGGWPTHFGSVLSNKEIPLVPIAGTNKKRKDVQVGLVNFTNDDGLSDLHNMGFRRRTNKPGIRRLEPAIPTTANPAEKDKPLLPTTRVGRVITSEVVKQSRQIIDEVHDSRRGRVNPIHAPRYDPVLHPALPPPMKYEYNPSNPAKPKPELYPILHPYRPTPRDKVFLPGDPLPGQAGPSNGLDTQHGPPQPISTSAYNGHPRLGNGVMPSVLAPAPAPPTTANHRQLPPEHAMYQKTLTERERKRADEVAMQKTQEAIYAEQVKARQDLMKRAANGGSMLGGAGGLGDAHGLGGSKFGLQQIPPFNPARKDGMR